MVTAVDRGTATGVHVRVAAVQAASVFLDRGRTVDKAVRLIGEAASNGARLVAFGEAFIPGHPIWFHFLPATDPRSMELGTALVDNAVTIPGAETDALCEAARAGEAMVVIGVVERPDRNRSVIFDSQLVIGPDGRVQGVRRKLVPVVGERVVFTPGSGDSIVAFDSPWGPVSVLAGGENANPLLTYAMRSLGARIHVAAWPPHFNKPRIMQEVMTITGRAVAYQNSAYVVAVAGATDPETIARVTRTKEDRALAEEMSGDPASVVFAPRGPTHGGPLPGGEAILYADLDLSAGTWAQLVNRQYDRPDLFHLAVDRSPGPVEIGFVGRPWSAAAGETGASGSATPDAQDARVRRMIRERFGDRLSGSDAEQLVPYVSQVLARSEELAATDLTRDDPWRTTFAEDSRLSE